MTALKSPNVQRRIIDRRLAVMHKIFGSNAAQMRGGFEALLISLQSLSVTNEFEILKHGLPSLTWSLLSDVGFTRTEIASIVGTSLKTIQRKESAMKELDLVEGDRTLRLLRILAETVDAIGDTERAIIWLRSKLRYLGGKSPLEMLSTEAGTQLVRQSLGAIARGGVA